MAKRKNRGLSADEQELWSRVTETAIPLQPGRPQLTANKLLKEEKKPPTPKVASFLPPKPEPYSAATIQRGKPALAMDKKAFRKMTSGKLAPEARIDLHGMTIAQAHPALTGFIMRSHAAGKRLVLVITGKGRPSTDPSVFAEQGGVLRRQVPLWLQQGNLGPLVLQTATASKTHGGSGALYVYLRRTR